MASRGGLNFQSRGGGAKHVSNEALRSAAHEALRSTFGAPPPSPPPPPALAHLATSRDLLASPPGFDSFRGRQLDAIVAALQGQDVFVLMPTGETCTPDLNLAQLPAVGGGLLRQQKVPPFPACHRVKPAENPLPPPLPAPGAGKSLCYALPAAMRRGVVLVVSPLIALMQDQVQVGGGEGEGGGREC